MKGKTSRFMPRLLLILALVLGGSIVLKSQSVTAGLLGTVTDQQGAVVAGVEVTLTEPSTGITKTGVTDANGNYNFQEVKPGVYVVRMSKQGFTTYQAENVLIENLQQRRVDALLVVGGAAETVTVDAGAAVITTEGGTITSSFDKQRVADNPSIDNYPSPYSLFTTLPGVQGNGWDLKVAGQAPSQQTIGLDGVINDRHGEQNNNINFYEQANLTIVNATADNARVVNYNLVSKRGENKFHGMAYYKRFDSAFDANDFFANYYGEPKAYSVQHEAQVEGSGPIWKNKTFFYASWFYHRIPTGGRRTAFVPTAAMREGDFTDLLSLRDTDGNPAPQYLKDPMSAGVCAPPADISGCLRDPSRATSANPDGLNLIPSNRLNPVSLKFQEYFPIPNAPVENLKGVYNFIHPFADDYFKASFPFVRIDHQITSSNSIYGKWTQRKTPYVLDYGNMPGFYWTRLRDHSQLSITDTHIFRPNIVNTFTFGRSKDFIEDGTEVAEGYPMFDGNEVIQNTGIQGMNPAGLQGAGFPQVNFNGNFTALDVAVDGGIKNNDKTYSFEDNVSWTKGRHTFKFGGNYIKFQTFTGEVPNYGTVSFTGIFTRNISSEQIRPAHAYADFLLGTVRRSSRSSPRINRERNINEVGLYVTDSFKVSRNLTIDAGIRWDYYGAPSYKDGLQYRFDSETGDIIINPGTLSEVDPRYPVLTPSRPNGIRIVEGDVTPNADTRNIRPRLAAAYRFTDDFVVRGGYGAFTERFSRFYTDFALGAGPFSRSGESFEATAAVGPTALLLPNPFRSDTSGLSPLGAQTVTGYPLDLDDGVIHQFNASVEKEMFGLGLRASYVGSRGTGLRAWTQLNARPIQATDAPLPLAFPKFALNGVSWLRDDFQNKYDAIQFEVQKRRGDFTFHGHYTYAVNKNNVLNSPNPFEPNSQWANDANNRRHLAVVTTTWHLPIGRGRQFLRNAPGLVDAIVGGWRLQTVSYFGSGFYVTPYSCGHPSNQYGGDCIRPDQIGDPSLPRGERSIDRWFDGGAYADPAAGTYGNALANSIEGPGLHVHHLSAAKTFTIKERFRFTFTAAFSNLFNTPNFSNPDSDIYWDPDYSGQRIYGTTGNGGGAPENAGHRVGYLKLRFEF